MIRELIVIKDKQERNTLRKSEFSIDEDKYEELLKKLHEIEWVNKMNSRYRYLTPARVTV